jgi:sporulation protein YlmC with PRC-barrel domain
MRKKIYSIIAMFMFSILFVAGNAYAYSSYSSYPDWVEGPVTFYSQSTVEGWDTFEASRMIGTQLFSTEGDYLGRISDLAIDSGSGHISDVVLSDVPGMGAELVSVPFAALSHGGGSIFALKTPEEFSGLSYRESAYSYWTDLRYFYFTGPSLNEQFKFSELIGSRVQGSQGERIGTIDDLVINFSDRRAVYSVFSEGEGMEGRMVAVPFSTLSGAGENIVVFNGTREKLLASPDFHWTNTADRNYAEDIYRYHGLQPYWEEGMR